ncbi:MAG: hypothetical protein D6682_06090 [Zetaproteobacteria bacterium]|nr:MAG: hypothetical protein D6682_06090 [Zetaproteobacteria bacterium]
MKRRTVAGAAALALTMGASGMASAGGITIAEHGDSTLKVEGLVFTDLTRATTKTDGVKTARSSGVNVSRTYLTTKYRFNDDWMFRVTLDSVLEPGTLKKNNNIFLKYAYLQGKLAGNAAVLRLGLSHTPWIDHEEHLWGHRYLSNVLTDTLGYEASSDAGIGLEGKLMDGTIDYWVVAVNGGGYGNTKKHDAMDYSGRIGLHLVDGLTLDFQYRAGYHGKRDFGTPAPNGKQTLGQFMATYGGHDYRVGVNYIIDRDDTGATDKAKNANFKNTAYAVWGYGKVGDGFGLVGRFEREDGEPINGLTAGQFKQKRTRYLAGIEFSPTKHVDFTLAYDNTKYTNKGYVSTATAGATTEETKYGLWSQFKF